MDPNWIQEIVDKAASKGTNWDKMKYSTFNILDQMYGQGNPPKICLFLLLDIYEQMYKNPMKNTLTYIYTLWLTERKISMDEIK